ncbi:MAG: protein-glutamate O-methyltransferase [Acidobacteria bacterium]|nr:protein-glutamate O-methyltransferase [Acidobacteriota bacterium]
MPDPRKQTSSSVLAGTVDLSRTEYDDIRQMVYDVCRIDLGTGKAKLVTSRLMKHMRALGLETFSRYLECVRQDRSGRELATMVDLLTTNKTGFFRENRHFEYLRQMILPKQIAAKRRLRLWSAGCSSGEEPFSVGILLREEIPNLTSWDVRILGTDISDRVLTKARAAVYEEDALKNIWPSIPPKYFSVARTMPTRAYRVADSVRSLVRFAKLNLMGAWPMKGPFDVIFCRNVMIYFDKPTQQALVRRFWELLEPGGHLFVGHSESLAASASEFRYVQPAIYVK